MEISTQLKESLNVVIESSESRKMKRSLKEFTKNSWPTIEPSRDFYDNWHIDVCISEHLQAVVHGDIKRLIINVPRDT